MQRKQYISIVIFVGTILLLLPNFYRNRWSVVDADYYFGWQTRYDRLVVARLVETRQAGFFSAGGLLGLGDENTWTFDAKRSNHQYSTYVHNRNFQTYLPYKSNPGFQGIVYGMFDKFTTFSGDANLKIFRGFTALASAIVFGLIVSVFANEFGLLSGILTLLFAMLCMWIVLPAGSIFWDLWAFFLPFVASAAVLADSAKKNQYQAGKIHIVVFIAALMKFLFSGFDLSTTILVMATVPFVFYGVYGRWDLKTFLIRLIKFGIALSAAALTALIILSAQITAAEGKFTSATDHILNKVGSYAEGSSEFFTNPDVQVGKISAMEVVNKYLVMPAIDIQYQGLTFQVLYWHLIVVFALFTIIFLIKHRVQGNVSISRKALALIVTTWYSILAPLSWYVLFKPHAFIHTHVNSMGWQMPFTLLGFALCGFVITDFFTSKEEVAVSVPPSPALQTD